MSNRLRIMTVLALACVHTHAQTPLGSRGPLELPVNDDPPRTWVDESLGDETLIEQDQIAIASTSTFPPDDPESGVSTALWLNPKDASSGQPNLIEPVAGWLQSTGNPDEFDLATQSSSDARSFESDFRGDAPRSQVGVDLYSPPEFEGGLLVIGEDVAMKIGGYVKADFIYDFDPIDNTDAFDTTTIPVGAPERTNSRAHARQTRMSFDTRWKTSGNIVRIFVEGDFFSEGDRYRLRHAYGEVGSLLVGQTWTTFSDVGASPATLDFEGSVSNVNRRQAQARWTQPLIEDLIDLSVSLEDTQFIVIPPPAVPGESRSPSPDFVARLRLLSDRGHLQFAGLYRNGAFQPDNGSVIDESAWGMNCTGSLMLTEDIKWYYQILFGEGIGSYRGLPDAAPVSPVTDKLLPMFGWMTGFTLDWTDTTSSNFTYAVNRLETTPIQNTDDVRGTSYMAANVMWTPLNRVTVGVEYLYGVRQNVSLLTASANRFQAAFIFDLP